MRLHLHIGTEKTGSTALQSYLAAHREVLAAEGVVMPDFLESSNHRALASVFMRDEQDDDYLQAEGISAPAARAKRRKELIKALKLQLRRAKASHRVMIISSEHFHSRLLSQAEVTSFCKAIFPLFKGVKVTCYLRRQDLMALSFYTQKLRGGFIPPTILPIRSVRLHRPELPPFFDYLSLLERWESAAGTEAIEPVVYERSSLINGDVIQDFFARIKCKYPGNGRQKTLNSSYSAAGQLALLTFNRLHAGNQELRAQSQEVRLRLDQFLQESAPGDAVLPSREEADEFMQAFVDSNRRVARKWFEREELFIEPGPSYPENDTPPDWEKASLLLAKFAGEVGSLDAC
ncbi:MAG: hypothetical protein AAF098_11905 [Pseudomonadota bacterium]